jgi:hypothetical protein
MSAADGTRIAVVVFGGALLALVLQVVYVYDMRYRHLAPPQRLPWHIIFASTALVLLDLSVSIRDIAGWGKHFHFVLVFDGIALLVGVAAMLALLVFEYDRERVRR